MHVCVCVFRGPGSESGRVQRYCWCAGPHQQLHQVPRYEHSCMSVRVFAFVCDCVSNDWEMQSSLNRKKEKKVSWCCLMCAFIIRYSPITLFARSLTYSLWFILSILQRKHSPLCFPALNCPLTFKLFTSTFFTPSVFVCVDILCNLSNPPGYSSLHHPCPTYTNPKTVPSKMLVSTSLTTVSGDV